MGTKCSTTKSNRKQKSDAIKTHRKTKTRHKTSKPHINNHIKKNTLLTWKQISYEYGYWQCDICTYINAPTSDKCMVCQLHQTTTDIIVSVLDASKDNTLTIDRTTMHQGYTWQFLAKNNEWSDLDMNTVIKLEALNINESMNYCFCSFKYTVFKLSDFKCIQYNNSTNAQRQLRRIYIDENTQNMNKGNIYFQYGHYTKSQIEIISAAFNDKFNQYPLSLLCVGYWRLNGYLSVMNVVRHLCESYLSVQYTSNKLYYGGLPKLVFGGMGCVLSQYDIDNTFGYEITTNYKSVGFDEWSELIVKEFAVLKYNLLRNGDIVIPVPSYDALRKHYSLYHDDMKGKQVINHRIGIGDVSLPFRYRLFIQEQIDELKYYATNISVVEQQLFL